MKMLPRDSLFLIGLFNVLIFFMVWERRWRNFLSTFLVLCRIGCNSWHLKHAFLALF